MGEYRRNPKSNTWHFCTNCSSWPLNGHISRSNKPSSGEFCSECLSKRQDGYCSDDPELRAGALG